MDKDFLPATNAIKPPAKDTIQITNGATICSKFSGLIPSGCDSPDPNNSWLAFFRPFSNSSDR